MIACVPFLAAPGGVICGHCYGFWEDKLGIYEDVMHQAEIERGDTYLVRLDVAEGAAELAIDGDVDGVECFADAGETECTFDAVDSGVASFKISADAQGAQTSLALELM